MWPKEEVLNPYGVRGWCQAFLSPPGSWEAPLPHLKLTLQGWFYHLHLVDEEAEAQAEAGLGRTPSCWIAWSLVF